MFGQHARNVQRQFLLQSAVTVGQLGKPPDFKAPELARDAEKAVALRGRWEEQLRSPTTVPALTSAKRSWDFLVLVARAERVTFNLQ